MSKAVSAQKISNNSDFSGAVEVPPEEPRPLMRELPPAPDYPADQFGPVMQGAVAGIYAMTQAPMAICAQSVLAVAALAVQAFHDVETFSGQVVPLSLFLVSVAGSGDRKSSADNRASTAITERQKELHEAYEVDLLKFQDAHDAYKKERENIIANKKLTMEQRKRALGDIGPPPVAPLQPLLTAKEPTYEGLVKSLAVGMPSIGIFTAEGGQFVSGHAMNSDNRLKTAAGLSEMWDGSSINRVRAGDGSTTLYGRRVSMHLMMQRDVASQMLGDGSLKDQGLLSRVLVAAPESLAGRRQWSEPSMDDRIAVDRFKDRALKLLRQVMPLAEGKQNELKPGILRLTDDAKKLCIDFYNEIEGQVSASGQLHSVRGLANKVPEHAVRIAAVLAVFEGAIVGGDRIGADYMARGIAIARYYLTEALRQFDAQSIGRDIEDAQAALTWMQTNWADGDLISVADIYQRGPQSIRTASAAKPIVSILVSHGWLTEAGRGTVCGVPRKQTYRIHGWRGPAS